MTALALSVTWVALIAVIVAVVIWAPMWTIPVLALAALILVALLGGAR